MTMREDYAVILDFLPLGKPDDPRGTPVAQALGTQYYTLLELIPKPGVSLSPFEVVYIGKGERDKIRVVRGRIRYEDLTSVAKGNLEEAVTRIVREREKEYVEFFNKARAITIRLHSLELLPGIGKKHLFKILEEREKKPFESFEDIKKRIPLMPDPLRCIVGRIIEEIQGGCKYYLFARPPGR